MTKRIPLHKHIGPPSKGSEKIVAYALVDDGDFPLLSKRLWRLHKTGYAHRYVPVGDGQMRSLMMHRELLGLLHGDRSRECDHINLDRLDNRHSNLRLATRSENFQNRRSYKGSTSKYRGVSWHKAAQKWVAQARLNNQQHYLGLYDSEEEAARVASAWRAEHMPYSSDFVTKITG